MINSVPGGVNQDAKLLEKRERVGRRVAGVVVGRVKDKSEARREESKLIIIAKKKGYYIEGGGSDAKHYLFSNQTR